MYGCKDSPYYYSDWLNSPFNATTPTAIHQYGYLLLPVCRHSEPYPGLAVVIFISFTLICAFILMSIMIAVVTAGIRDRIEEIQGLSLANTANNKLQMFASPKHEEKESMTRDSSERSPSAKHSLAESFDPELVLLMLKQVWKNAAKTGRQQKMKPISPAAANKVGPLSAPSGRAYIIQQYSSIDYWRAFSFCDNFKRQSIALRNLTNHPIYQFVFTVIVILAALLEMVVLQESALSSPRSLAWIEWIQYVFQAYFMADIFFRVKAHYPDYNSYFESPWNVFDVVLVLLTLLPILATGTSARDSLGLKFVNFVLNLF